MAVFTLYDSLTSRLRASGDYVWPLVLGAMLLFGLFTRFAAIALIVVTVVATAAVHWPAEWSSLAELWSGYAITSKVLSLSTIWVEPTWGFTLLAAAIIAMAIPEFTGKG
jgi:hypothetical protein